MIQLLKQFGIYDGTQDGEIYTIEGETYKLNENWRLIPTKELPENHLGWMYDGADAVIDGKKTFKVHSRAETTEEYKELST